MRQKPWQREKQSGRKFRESGLDSKQPKKLLVLADSAFLGQDSEHVQGLET